MTFREPKCIKTDILCISLSILDLWQLNMGNTYKSRIQKIMNIQKKIVRLMTFKSYLEHSEPIFKYLNILDIFKINDYLIALFMFRYHHLNNLSDFFLNYFLINNQIHEHIREMLQNFTNVIKGQIM